jgi:hypothetical protein
MCEPEHNTCRTCMFYDPDYAWCDTHNEGTHSDFECNDHKEKVK